MVNERVPNGARLVERRLQSVLVIVKNIGKPEGYAIKKNGFTRQGQGIELRLFLYGLPAFAAFFSFSLMPQDTFGKIIVPMARGGEVNGAG